MQLLYVLKTRNLVQMRTFENVIAVTPFRNEKLLNLRLARVRSGGVRTGVSIFGREEKSNPIVRNSCHLTGP